MKFISSKTVFLIDGGGFLYRAYYGIKPLHTKTGVPVQAVYSFCRMIKKLIAMFQPCYLALVWDSKGPTQRHELYPEYKATRQEPPSDLFEQKAKIMEFADLIGLHQLAKSGLEADDLIYSLAKEQAEKGMTVVMITFDKDMGQVIRDQQIVMYDPFKDAIIDEEKLAEAMGFPIAHLPVYFAMLGDASDNIPGVYGIGKKGAELLAQHFATLDELYENLEDPIISPRMRIALKTHKQNAYLSRDLWLLQYHATSLTLEDLAFDVDNWPQARPLFEELGFKSLLQDIGGPVKKISFEEKIERLQKYLFVTITTSQQLIQLVDQLNKAAMFAVDTEGSGLRTLEGIPVGVSFSLDDRRSYYIPCGHKTDDAQLSCEEIFSAIKPVLENTTSIKVMHNAKFDMLALSMVQLSIQKPYFDTMVAASLLGKEWERVGLKDLAQRFFGEEMLSYKQVTEESGSDDFSNVPLSLATIYSANDSLQTLRLAELFQKELTQQNLEALFYNLELPLVEILYAMEKEGIYLDSDILKPLDKQVIKDLHDIEQTIITYWGSDREKLNLNSPKQIQILLFDILKLPSQKKNPKGGYSTSQEVLASLAKLHPVAALILRYRELYKLKSTYIDALPRYINSRTGRIHTNYNQVFVATGRLSSSEPNLQNIPAGGYGIEIRDAFRPKPGHLFIAADYSQIELRVLAHLSSDKHLTQAFLSDVDIHAETASHLFDVPIEEVTHEQRQLGKRINFSILYGMTPYGLSKDLDIPLSDAKRYIEKYFAQYPQVLLWMKQVVEETIDNGYVSTWMGRRRYIPGIYEKNKTLFDQARRVAINTKAQGTAAEIMKKGMIDLYENLKRFSEDAHILLQIHDELLLSVSESYGQQIEEMTKNTLQQVVSWNVPLVVTTRIGMSWKQVTK